MFYGIGRPRPARVSGRCAMLAWHKRCSLLMLVLLLAILPARLAFAGTAGHSPREPKMVIIGDSYSIVAPGRGVDTAWPELVSRKLGIGEGRCTVYRHAGYGFARPGKTFLKLLEGVECYPTVTDVLVFGGVGNDFEVSKRRIAKSYKATIKRLRVLYPNAEIMQGTVDWKAKSPQWQRKLRLRLPFYKKLARRYGVVYLSGCEKVLRRHGSWFAQDGRHPNADGVCAIADVVARSICLHSPRYACRFTACLPATRGGNTVSAVSSTP